MAVTRRQDLLAEIERLRQSKVLVYLTGDRQQASANIGDDAVRPIFEHLRRFGAVDALDVFIYSRGGAIDVPWRLASAFRRASKAWRVLVPFRANSAATLLSLGADEIVLGPQAELGPIDPILSLSRAQPTGPTTQEDVAVEDIMAFVSLVEDRFHLVGEGARAAALARLMDRLDAVTLGSAFRTHSHIRALAGKMLGSRDGAALPQESIERITSALAEQVYAHGHAVGLEEAKLIGLPAVAADPELDQLMWALLEEYEADLRLREPFDPFAMIQTSSRASEPASLAVVESVGLLHEFRVTLDVQAQRSLPQSLQVQLNMPVQLPPGIQPDQLPAAIQAMFQQLQQAVLQQANAAVEAALRDQAPLVGCQVRLLGAGWQRLPIANEAD